MHTFSEQSINDFFPEFVDQLPDCAHWIDIKSFSDSKRLTAVGCQNGFVLCFLVDVDKKEICDSWSIEHSGPVTSVKLFTSGHTADSGFFLPDHHGSMSDSFDHDNNELTFHLLVTGALEVGVVYVDVVTKGFKNQLVLPDSDLNDSVLCCCVCDIDFDGQNEILLGTYGQVLQAYKYVNKNVKGDQTTTPPGEYKLLWQRGFSHPILAIDKIDITGDGIKEFGVLTTKGLHILQHNLEEVMAVCLEKLKICSQYFTPKDDPFQQLLSETFTDHDGDDNGIPDG